MLIIGDKELEDKKVTVRDRAGNDLGSMSIDQFCEMLKNEIN
jgi:threonyl-tRNA synthetase